MEHQELTKTIIGCAYKVYNKMGFGFLENVYEKCLLIELQKENLKAESQKAITVKYDNQVVGDYIADIIVEDKVIIELKAAESICEEHEAQLTNYLRATDIEVGLLVNFGKKPQIKRKVFNNELKNNPDHK